MSPEHVFDDADGLIALLRGLHSSRDELQRHLGLQRAAAMTEGPEAYRRLLGER